MTRLVLVIGSAPDALRARDFDCGAVSAIVALNNAWRVREDWTHVVFPEDFADDLRPKPQVGKQQIQYDAFVPANNAFGGIVYAGGTMAFTTSYWALHALKPDILAVVGCDMVYDGDTEQSHFYGRGEPDPLRDDPTLQSLEAKSERLRWLAFENGCLCVNLSKKTRSRLTFDRMRADDLNGDLDAIHASGMERLHSLADRQAAGRALRTEAGAAQHVVSGDYWNAEKSLDAQKLKTIDALWRKVFKTSGEV